MRKGASSQAVLIDVSLMMQLRDILEGNAYREGYGFGDREDDGCEDGCEDN